jgi:cyclic pyranopterin phosphate synthase
MAITDRCNLRCAFCMPAEGMAFMPREEILSFEEMERLLHILATMGITKVRITGGEPTLRKGLIEFLKKVRATPGIKEIYMTTNGILTAPYIPALKEIGIDGINLSIQTLNRENFFRITRRDRLEAVMTTYHEILKWGIPLKVNSVVMEGVNHEDIVPLTELAREHPIEMRFIEEMPFNGQKDEQPILAWNHQKILEVLQKVYPDLSKLEDKPYATARVYAIPGFKGTGGIIAGFSRLFCGSCNRIRILPKGTLKTCLYGEGVVDLRKLLRGSATDEEIEVAIRSAVSHRFKTGFEAERSRKGKMSAFESMSEIGG